MGRFEICIPTLQQIFLAFISGYRNMKDEWESVFQVFKIVPTFYGILRLITRITRVCRVASVHRQMDRVSIFVSCFITIHCNVFAHVCPQVFPMFVYE